MINAALKSLDDLKHQDQDNEPEFELRVRKYGHTGGLDFQMSIYGTGFEATRNFNLDELISVRDWIDEAIAASAVKDSAA